MRRIISRQADWHLHLAAAIKKSSPGDVIICPTPTMKKLAFIAAKRMGKEVAVEVEDNGRT